MTDMFSLFIGYGPRFSANTILFETHLVASACLKQIKKFILANIYMYKTQYRIIMLVIFY